MISPAVVAGLALLVAGYCLFGGDEDSRLRRLGAPDARVGSVEEVPTQGLGQRQRIIGSVAVALVSALLVPMPWGLAVGAAGAVAAYYVLARLESGATRARREALLGQQPEVLDLIAAAQEAGSPLRRAAGEVAALAPEPSASVLREVDAHLRVGFSEAEAWQSLADDPVWGSTARDLARSARTGEAVADTIHLHATRTREAHRDHLNKKARTVAVKSVGPMMACFLPAFILAGVVPIFVGIASRYLG